MKKSGRERNEGAKISHIKQKLNNIYNRGKCTEGMYNRRL